MSEASFFCKNHIILGLVRKYMTFLIIITLPITNQRVIFVSPENGFEKNLRMLTAIIPYSDAITLQFGSHTITLILPDSQLMAMVLKMVH